MKKVLLVTLTFIGYLATAQSTIPFSINSPPANLKLLGEGFISTSLNERDFAISPDGKEIYFTVSTPKSTFQTIVFIRQINGKEWTKPAVVSFGGEFSDLEPAFNADGSTLYFSSNRPLSGNESKDFDIWKVVRKGDTWGVPENLGSEINTQTDEFYPSITKSGDLYFTAAYKDGPGREDIYVARLFNNKYEKPIALDTAINSKFYEFNAFVSQDEKYILFTSYGRKDDMGGGDLYISVKDSKGNWSPALNLKELNSRQLDYCPYISPDGKSLFITSERHQLTTSYSSHKASYKEIVQTYLSPLNGVGNIYWIDFRKVLESTKE